MNKTPVREITLSEFVQQLQAGTGYLLSRWKTLLLAGLLFGLGGVLYAWLKKPLYIAEMSFVTESESKGGFNAYAGIAAQFGIDLGTGSNTLFEGDNLIELLKSRNLVFQTLLTPYNNEDGRTLADLYVDEVKADKKYKGQRVFTNDKLPARLRDSILLRITDKIVKDYLHIDKRDKQLSIIDLKMQSPHEGFSKRFSELLAEKAIAYYTSYKIKKSQQNVAILERQTDSVRNLLYGNIQDVAVSTDLNVNPIRQTQRAGTQRKQVEVQASAALYTELLKNLELSRLTLRKETPLIQIVDSPILPLKKKGIGRLMAGLIFASIGTAAVAALLLIRRYYLPNYKA